VSLVRFTGFNALDPRNDTQVVELAPESVTSVVSARTGDGYDYTVIEAAGMRWQVRETVAEVNERIGAGL
jgi:hypothetical protein